MTRSRSRTLRGHAALQAAVEWFGSPTDRPEELRGVPARNDYANREAILAFLADMDARGSRRVYLRPSAFDGTQDSVPLGSARFRPLIGDPDVDGDGGVFGFGRWGCSLEGVRIRMSAPGVLEMGDRWGDGESFGSHADAPFDDTIWDTDGWDLPVPVQPLSIPASALEHFLPRVAAIAADVLATHPTDRATAGAAIAGHMKACRPWSSPPPVTWFASPSAALDARSAAKTGYGNLKRDLRDRPLFSFDQETTVRLNGSAASYGHSVWDKGRGTALRDAVWRLASAALGYDAHRAMLDMIIARGVQQGFDHMGLVADHPRLAFYEFLRANGADLSDIVATFATMTSAVWLMFPTPTMVFAVDRPVAAVANEEEIRLVFSDDSRLLLPRLVGD